MEMIALVLFAVFAMAVIEHQKRSMRRLVDIRDRESTSQTRGRRR